jgi:hypothetical protein
MTLTRLIALATALASPAIVRAQTPVALQNGDLVVARCGSCSKMMRFYAGFPIVFGTRVGS